MRAIRLENTVKRKIIRINEELCNGCGKCALACAEGALSIIDGKAKVISEVFCDGLGACIGECPQNALTIEERDAPKFNEEEVEKHLESDKLKEDEHLASTLKQKNLGAQQASHCSCPSSKTMVFNKNWEETEASEEIPSALRQWPTKLILVSPEAPFFNNKELILVSDCSPVAYGDFHRKILKGKPIVTVCPMLGLGQEELEKLEQILKINPIENINLVLMEVPCCQKIKFFLEPIIASLGRPINIEETIVSRDGTILKKQKVEFTGI